MKYKKLSILAAGAMLATSLTPLANASAWTVSPASGSTVTIRREINDVATVVTNTFTYTIAADSNNPAAVTGLPATASIVFNNANPSGNKVSSYTNIDFSSAVFTKVGDYSFTITETGTTDESNYPLSTDSYTAYVSVRNETSGGVPTGNHVAALGFVSDKTGEKLETISGTDSEALFDGGVIRTYISMSKEVTGNNADEDQCFTFNVTFSGIVGVNFILTSDTTCTGNPASVSGDGTTAIYLKHGDTATIGNNSGSYEIPIGATYSITEQGATDYDTYVDGNTSATSKTSGNKVTVAATDTTNFGSRNTTSFVNNKETAPRTGIVFSILPFIIIAMIGIFGAAYVAKTKKVTE